MTYYSSIIYPDGTVKAPDTPLVIHFRPPIPSGYCIFIPQYLLAITSTTSGGRLPITASLDFN